jgi:hypothetical protein
MPGRLGQAAAQQGHLVLEDPDLGGQRGVDAVSTLSGSVAGIFVRHEAPPPAWFCQTINGTGRHARTVSKPQINYSGNADAERLQPPV